MFLRPQHFQQQDRYVEKLVRSRIAELAPHPWGISELEINRELLTIGKFGVSSGRGVFEDGTPFAVPEDVDHPAPIEIPDNTRNCIVYLVLPMCHRGGFDIDLFDVRPKLFEGRGKLGVAIGDVREDVLKLIPRSRNGIVSEPKRSIIAKLKRRSDRRAICLFQDSKIISSVIEQMIVYFLGKELDGNAKGFRKSL